jgi:hypothetical protein
MKSDTEERSNNRPTLVNVGRRKLVHFARRLTPVERRAANESPVTRHSPKPRSRKRASYRCEQSAFSNSSSVSSLQAACACDSYKLQRYRCAEPVSTCVYAGKIGAFQSAYRAELHRKLHLRGDQNRRIQHSICQHPCGMRTLNVLQTYRLLRATQRWSGSSASLRTRESSADRTMAMAGL